MPVAAAEVAVVAEAFQELETWAVLLVGRRVPAPPHQTVLPELQVRPLPPALHSASPLAQLLSLPPAGLRLPLPLQLEVSPLTAVFPFSWGLRLPVLSLLPYLTTFQPIQKSLGFLFEIFSRTGVLYDIMGTCGLLFNGNLRGQSRLGLSLRITAL